VVQGVEVPMLMVWGFRYRLEMISSGDGGNVFLKGKNIINVVRQGRIILIYDKHECIALHAKKMIL